MRFTSVRCSTKICLWISRPDLRHRFSFNLLNLRAWCMSSENHSSLVLFRQTSDGFTGACCFITLVTALMYPTASVSVPSAEWTSARWVLKSAVRRSWVSLLKSWTWCFESAASSFLVCIVKTTLWWSDMQLLYRSKSLMGLLSSLVITRSSKCPALCVACFTCWMRLCSDNARLKSLTSGAWETSRYKLKLGGYVIRRLSADNVRSLK